jgi:hypothetical protein
MAGVVALLATTGLAIACAKPGLKSSASDGDMPLHPEDQVIY